MSRPTGVAAVAAVLASAILVGAVATGAAPLGRMLSTGVPALGFGAGGILASVPDNLAQLPEVWAATQDGDFLPAGPSEVGPVPVPLPAATTAPQAPLYTRIPKPVLPDGPRRVGIQAGHWQTDAAPPELWRLLTQTGTSWSGIDEVDINLDIAERVKTILEGQGLVVDVLPTTIPPGYVADAFVALHADGDGTGENSGFKMAFSSRRTPYEADLLAAVKDAYASATGLPYDGSRVTRSMVNYYLFSWQRNRWSTAPHTPSVILEMGYLSGYDDRMLLTQEPDLVAAAIARGILAFLGSHTRDELFGQDLLVPARPQFRQPAPSPTGL